VAAQAVEKKVADFEWRAIILVVYVAHESDNQDKTTKTSTRLRASFWYC